MYIYTVYYIHKVCHWTIIKYVCKWHKCKICTICWEEHILAVAVSVNAWWVFLRSDQTNGSTCLGFHVDIANQFVKGNVWCT